MSILPSLSSIVDASSGKVRSLAAFNRASGEPMMLSVWLDPRTLDNERFVFVEVEADPNNDVIVGQYGNFKIVAEKDLPPLVTEDQLNQAAATKITKRYSVVEQINVIARAIDAIAQQTGVDVSELREMVAYVNDVKEANDTRKEYFAEQAKNGSVRYVSNDRAEEIREAQLDGGLHEAMGPKPGNQARVF